MMDKPIPMLNYRCARCGVFVGRKAEEHKCPNPRNQGRPARRLSAAGSTLHDATTPATAGRVKEVSTWGDLRAVRG